MRFSSGKAKLWSSLTLSAVLATGVLLCSGTANAQNLNVVYVESNVGSTPNANSVFGFSNDGNGNLTPLPSSPYLTGGTGFFDPTAATTSIDADHPIIIRQDGNLLFAVNAHTNTIAVFTINADGSLTTVAGSPFPSNGIEPISLALSDDVLAGDTDVLTVANKDNDPNQSGGTPNFTSFKVNAGGVLTPVTGSTINLASGAFPSQVGTFGQHGRYVLGLQFLGGSTLYSYHLKANGTMALNNTATEPSGNPLLGFVLNPVHDVVYMGLPTVSKIGVYSINHLTGNLAFLREVQNPGKAVCWLVTNTTGTRLYTADSGDGFITVYDITRYEGPVQIQNFAIPGSSQHPTNIALDPTGNFLYAVSGVQLHVLNVSSTDGTLTETITPTTLNVPTGEFPIGLVTAMR